MKHLLIIGLLNYGVASGIDTIQTVKCLSTHQCLEANPIFQPITTSKPLLITTKATLTTTSILVLWKARRTHPKLAIWGTMGLMVGQSIVVISNYKQLQKR
jgi:hypothetical protein